MTATTGIVGMCVLAACSEQVTARMPHVRLSDGSPIHMDCIGALDGRHGQPVVTAPVHHFSTARLLVVPVLEQAC